MRFGRGEYVYELDAAWGQLPAGWEYGDAVGVRVDSQVATITTATSYASSKPPMAHFGLGSADAAPSIEVTWPDGLTQVVKPDGVDRLVTITRSN